MKGKLIFTNCWQNCRHLQRWGFTVQICWSTSCPRFRILPSDKNFNFSLSITNASSPTHNMHVGFNMEMWTRTTWQTGWILLDRWVEHSHHQPVLMSDYSNTRELSFTLADDIYIRYLSFTGAEDLEAEMIKRFNSLLSLFSVYWIQIVGVPTRLTLVLCTMRDQAITRNWRTFHHRL